MYGREFVVTTEQLLDTSFAVWYADAYVGVSPELRKVMGAPVPSLEDLERTHTFIGIFLGETMDDIFSQLNGDEERDYRSMSTGDIVVGGDGAFVCDSLGWRPL